MNKLDRLRHRMFLSLRNRQLLCHLTRLIDEFKEFYGIEVDVKMVVWMGKSAGYRIFCLSRGGDGDGGGVQRVILEVEDGLLLCGKALKVYDRASMLGPGNAFVNVKDSITVLFATNWKAYEKSLAAAAAAANSGRERGGVVVVARAVIPNSPSSTSTKSVIFFVCSSKSVLGGPSLFTEDHICYIIRH
ncbi:hypothetical protein HDU76_009983 [Blyttiomyces sp. JEL0837]|nr:hypothetical protein HDU76_009983 [Blyttiomyces sp. JEL0837]